MSDLISRQAVLSVLVFADETKDMTCKDMRKVMDVINAIPSAEPERTAKVEEDEWTEHKMLSRDYGKIYYQHDCCCDLYESPYQFCPYCGKKMKRKNNE